METYDSQGMGYTLYRVYCFPGLTWTSTDNPQLKTVLSHSPSHLHKLSDSMHTSQAGAKAENSPVSGTKGLRGNKKLHHLQK